MIYAVHRITKEHRVTEYPGAYQTPGSVWRLFYTYPDGWIEWESEVDACPLPRHHRCRIRLSCGSEFEVGDPETWDWSKGGDQWIIAYRPILDAEPKPEPPAWDGESWPPPIGARTRQLGWMGERYGEVLIVGHHNGLPVGCTGPDVDDYQAFIQGELSPIRSEEDRAKEAIAGEVLSAMDNGLGSCFKDVQIAAVIYSAIRDGKVPGVKLTGGE